MIPLENITGVPIAIYPGTKDSIVNIEGSRELREIINKDSLIEYKELDFDHMTFVLGKKMDYFSGVINLIDRYNKQSDYKRSVDKIN